MTFVKATQRSLLQIGFLTLLVGLLTACSSDSVGAGY